MEIDSTMFLYALNNSKNQVRVFQDKYIKSVCKYVYVYLKPVRLLTGVVLYTYGSDLVVQKHTLQVVSISQRNKVERSGQCPSTFSNIYSDILGLLPCHPYTDGERLPQRWEKGLKPTRCHCYQVPAEAAVLRGLCMTLTQAVSGLA